MTALVNPHFKVPFEFRGSSAACVEQDSLDEIAQCVEAIVRTPRGFRLEIPNFGIENPALSEGTIVPQILAAIEEWEPRARVTLSEHQLEDILSKQLKIEVGHENA
jgi:phage baseplate assembly protein W